MEYGLSPLQAKVLGVSRIAIGFLFWFHGAQKLFGWFGGFGEACFAAYGEVSPLAPGWQDRVGLHQLAPLVVHAIKFGGGYVGATLQALAALA